MVAHLQIIGHIVTNINIMGDKLLLNFGAKFQHQFIISPFDDTYETSHLGTRFRTLSTKMCVRQMVTIFQCPALYNRQGREETL